MTNWTPTRRAPPAMGHRAGRAPKVCRQPFREVNLPACEIFRKEFKGVCRTHPESSVLNMKVLQSSILTVAETVDPSSFG